MSCENHVTIYCIVYQQLLTSCDASQRPLLLLACAMCVFAEKDLEECKNLLFKV